MACIFCEIANHRVESNVVYEDGNVIAFFDINPANEYHTLVIPKTHYKNIFDAPESVLKEIMTGIKRVVELYEKKLSLSNLQIISNAGREAQQDVDHIHFHIVPRYRNDGQDIKWRNKEELRDKFPELLADLGIE